jgi:leader peptidase (prepilin peptidase)/N-methyltransferase
MGFLVVIAALKSGLLSFPIILNSYFLIQNYWLLATGYWLLIVAIFAVILLISVYDLKHFIIPDSFLIFLFIFAFLHNSLFIILDSFSLVSWLLATSYWLLFGFILTIPFLLIFLFSRGSWFGFGDVKYIAVLGFWLGFANGLSAVVLAFWIGAGFALLAMGLKKITPNLHLPLFTNNLTIKSEVPFGPFLSLGAVIAFCLNLDLFQINALLNIF